MKIIANFFKRSQYVSNEVAATIIRNFASGLQTNPYAWDDLETTSHSNPEVELAVQLCWYFASVFPAERTTEYCGKKAFPYFMAVADALENGQFHSLRHVEFIEAVKRGELPPELKTLSLE